MIWLNGAILAAERARIDPADRGLTLADGLFETLRAYRGKPFRLGDHLKRLVEGAAALGISPPYPTAEIAAAVVELLQANALTAQDAALRITLTRGTGPRGLAPPKGVHPTLLITAVPYHPLPEACSAAIASIRRNEGSPLSRLKSLAYLDNVLAAREVEERGAEEAILLNNAGKVACAARANLFALVGDHLVTPPIGDGVLPGIARRTVLELAQDLGIAAEERSLRPADLAQAREILLTNSLFEIRSVAKLDGRVLVAGEIAARLHGAYREMAASLAVAMTKPESH